MCKQIHVENQLRVFEFGAEHTNDTIIIMNLLVSILLTMMNAFNLVLSSIDLCDNTLLIHSISSISQEYIPLRYVALKTFVITNPCHTEKSILIRNNSIYEFDRKRNQWNRLCVSRTIFDKQVFILFNRKTCIEE